MRNIFLKALLCGLFIPSVFISCTTSDDGEEEEASVEGELNSELDEVDGVGDETLAGDSVEDSEFDDFEDNASGGDQAAGNGGGEDDDFFAEDADNPSDDTQDMAEKDLQKELEKSDAGGAETAAVESLPVEPTPAPVPATPTPAPSTAGAGGLITSKETPLSTDGFEVVAPSIAMPNEDLGISDPLVADVDPPLPAEKAAKEVVPVSKIRKEPFFSKKGRLINTVYIARAGDDLGTISQKLFEKDNAAILVEDNADLDDGVSIGEKVYYNSPTRSDDRKEILTYYEDKKMPAQYYITKQGDSIQNIGREVLGHDEAWKEIWALNESLQTQALLPAGLKIRYWSGNELQAPPVEPPIMASTDSPDSTSGAAGTTAPATNSDGPTETLPDISQETPTEDPANLPQAEVTPMPSDIATSAPPMPPTLAKEDGDSLLTVAGIAIIGLAVITLVAIQIKNRKRDDGSIPPSLEFTKV